MVRVRIAPSPTGEDLHIGNAYTALINFVFAKKHQGKFVVRIEDTDRSRFVEGSEDSILASLDWLGLSPDESPKKGGPYSPYRQSERLSIYKELAHELIKKGHAYYCFCTTETLSEMRKEQQTQGLMPKYDRRCLGLSPEEVTKRLQTKHFVIRIKIPDGQTTFEDIIHGPITIQNAQLDDQVILKSDGYPTYHLGVVVDDHLMEISHIIRGEEWISSTPKHVLLFNFFGWELPKFAHVPLLRNPDKSKLSKRKNPVWVSWYKDEGFLPEAITNYLALMGWSHPEGKEIFSLDEYMKVFTLERIQTVGPIFDVEKLKWMNSKYIQKKANESPEKLADLLSTFSIHKPKSKSILTILALIKERIRTVKEFDSMAGFFFERPKEYEKSLDVNNIDLLLSGLKSTNWKKEKLEKVVRQLAEEHSIKPRDLFMDLRIAITGKQVGPPLLESMEILGKDECLERLKQIVKN